MIKKSHLGLIRKLVNLMQKDWISGMGRTKMPEKERDVRNWFCITAWFGEFKYLSISWM